MFDCYVSDKRTLYLHFISTLVISARSVLYLIVTSLISAYFILRLSVRSVISVFTILVLHCEVSNKHTLCFVLIITLVISAHYILCLAQTILVLHCDISNKSKLSFALDCYVSEKVTLCLSVRSVISTNYTCTSLQD